MLGEVVWDVAWVFGGEELGEDFKHGGDKVIKEFLHHQCRVEIALRLFVLLGVDLFDGDRGTDGDIGEVNE